MEKCSVADIKKNSLGQEITYFFTDSNNEIKAMYNNIIINTGFFDTLDFWHGSDYEPIFVNEVFRLRFMHENLKECKFNFYTCSNLLKEFHCFGICEKCNQGDNYQHKDNFKTINTNK